MTKGKTLKQQLMDREQLWKRAVADYRNLERRINEQQQVFVKFASAALVEKLLGIGDDLERANQHLHDQGLGLIIDRFRQVLKDEGVDQIEAMGKEFDPLVMECQDTVEGEKNQVVKVIVPGYTLNGKVLRPAKVAVGGGSKV